MERINMNRDEIEKIVKKHNKIVLKQIKNEVSRNTNFLEMIIYAHLAIIIGLLYFVVRMIGGDYNFDMDNFLMIVCLIVILIPTFYATIYKIRKEYFYPKFYQIIKKILDVSGSQFKINTNNIIKIFEKSKNDYIYWKEKFSLVKNNGTFEYKISYLDINKTIKKVKKPGLIDTIAMYAHDRKLFSGLVVEAEFNKNFRSDLYIKQDKFEKLIGDKTDKINFTGRNVVRLENIEFEKVFKIYSNDEIESRYILSSTFMERLLNINDKWERGIEATFINNKMYLFIDCKKIYSETKKMKVDLYEKLYEIINSLDEIMEILELNNNIWK